MIKLTGDTASTIDGTMVVLTVLTVFFGILVFLTALYLPTNLVLNSTVTAALTGSLAVLFKHMPPFGNPVSVATSSTPIVGVSTLAPLEGDATPAAPPSLPIQTTLVNTALGKSPIVPSVVGNK